MVVFGDYTLDVQTRELRRGLDTVAVQPQVLDLLLFLIANRDHVVSKDQLVDAIWQGRAISDSALTTRINAARTAVGDSGKDQRVIRTIARRGFRFVADVRETLVVAEAAVTAAEPLPSYDREIAVETAELAPRETTAAVRRASLAVLPFLDLSLDASGSGRATADAIVFDIITRLAKLRALFVIAAGTTFALRERGIGVEQSASILNVDYVATGSVRRSERRLTVAVELMEGRTSRVVWAEVFDRPIDDTFLVLNQVGDAIVTSITSEIETVERNRAILKPPDSLDAWDAHHRALWHMYRFNKTDNQHAQHFFEQAIRLDPTFARAHAGLSFVHWQNAFQGWQPREAETERAYASAGESLMADDHDPAGHWAMGRALWLRGRIEHSVAELSQSVALSPSFAQAHYSLGFVHATMGKPAEALVSSGHSYRLSPLDPMLFANLAVRAMANARLGRFEEAAEWGARGAARPNAHVQIIAIAAYTAAMAGRTEEARRLFAEVRSREPNYGIEEFFKAMQVTEESRAAFRKAAALLETNS